ncbi:protein of unknown function [Butyrivibrio hungatei]|uniref:Mobile element protein CD1107-like domain-containing protein n=1 Tax=Butyrivibrio hungatei TaxID=185008 RepID=A0A1G5BE55_9FIRM|nr:DUF4366 domain-containing protein [Butyrivibrio hungatei]SCX88443.1 protein of unknown function [Butyrivibrio hungatei]
MMKNRFKLPALAASLMIWAFPVTAYAYVPENVDTSVIDEDKDAVKDEGKEKNKEEEDHKPLTPEGNTTIVDDNVSSDNHSKQFMTVTTKNGKIFYIIVDRDNTTGANNVHFLNQVDERDLMDLLSDEEKKELEGQEGDDIETPIEPVQQTQQPQDIVATEEPELEVVKEKKKPNLLLGLIIVLGLAGVAGFYFYSNSESFKRRKNGEDPDSDYADDYIDIPEDKEEE